MLDYMFYVLYVNVQLTITVTFTKKCLNQGLDYVNPKNAFITFCTSSMVTLPLQLKNDFLNKLLLLINLCKYLVTPFTKEEYLHSYQSDNCGPLCRLDHNPGTSFH